MVAETPPILASEAVRGGLKRSPSIPSCPREDPDGRCFVPSLPPFNAPTDPSICSLLAVALGVPREIAVDMDQKLAAQDWNNSNVDFDAISSFSLRCSIEKGTHTEFEWLDYAPSVFRTLQECGEINIDDYLDSVRGRETIKLLLSNKKNVSAIPLPHDDRFILKILNKSEMKFFTELLPKYYQHVQKYRNTLLTRFYGLHVLKPQGGQKIRFIVTGNVLRSDVTIHKHFNLRAPTQGRHAGKADEDFNIAFLLQSSIRRQFLSQVKHDCNFLEEVGMMNYSFLLGMHVCPAPFEAVVQGRFTSPNSTGSDDGKKKPSDGAASEQTNATEDSPRDNVSESPEPEIKIGVKVPARAVDIRKRELLRSTGKEQLNNVVLYFGIVNVLQGYSMLRHVENVFKSLQSDSPAGSAANPKAYSTRFQEYLCSIFPETDSDVCIL